SSHDAWAFSPITPGNTIRISYSPQAISIKHHGNGCIEISSCVVDCSRGINQVIYSQKKLVENVDTIFVSVGSRMILNNGIKIEGIKIAYSISPDSNQNNDSPFQNVQPIQPLQMQAQPATPPSSPPRTPPQQTSASIFFARNPDTPEFLNVVVTPERGVSQRPRTFNTPKTPECFPLSCERESNISSASLYPENVLPRIYRGPETDAFGPVCDEADLDACLSGRSSQSSSSQWSIHSLGCSDDNMDTDFPS
ncbi:hypothetical protein HOD08_01565, partial [bacterium]|nr:hypothetical protein [bacterium]